MAVRENKNEDNVAGKFYVDDQCINCDLCREICPECFDVSEKGDYSVVVKQPENDEEISLCEEAMESCPVKAIGNDGDS